MQPPATRFRLVPIAPAATAAAIAVLAAIASHIALGLGHPRGAVAFAAIQAAAAATAVGFGLHRRWLGMLTAALLLGALAAGACHAAWAALPAMSGTAHALLYAGFLYVFANSLRPGRTALVTMVASRVNPGFHPGMIPYTRAVTWAWALLFAAQLLASAILLATDRPLWSLFVTLLHLPVVLAMALLESAIRHRRWRHERPTSLIETIRGTRRLMAQRAANSSITR